MPAVPILVLDLTQMTNAGIRNLPLPVLARVTLLCLAIASGSRDVMADLHAWIPDLR